MVGKGTQLDIAATDGGLVLVGEVDGQTAPALGVEVERLLESSPDVRLDVRGVAFMDSSGLRTLLDVTDQARGQGGDVVLVGPTPAVLRLLDLSHLDDHFTVEVVDEPTETPDA